MVGRFAIEMNKPQFFTHTTCMKTRVKKDINPTDRMIQANKDEAGSMLSLWGMKNRKHIKPKGIKK